jgi:acetyltransferase-like isoleucine patch superfamily enzyme
MTGVDANEPSIVTVGNNVSLMTGVDVNVLSVATVGNNVSYNRQYIYIYTSHE